MVFVFVSEFRFKDFAPNDGTAQVVATQGVQRAWILGFHRFFVLVDGHSQTFGWQHVRRLDGGHLGRSGLGLVRHGAHRALCTHVRRPISSVMLLFLTLYHLFKPWRYHYHGYAYEYAD